MISPKSFFVVLLSRRAEELCVNRQSKKRLVSWCRKREKKKLTDREYSKMYLLEGKWICR